MFDNLAAGGVVKFSGMSMAFVGAVQAATRARQRSHNARMNRHLCQSIFLQDQSNQASTHGCTPLLMQVGLSLWPFTVTTPGCFN